MRISARCRAARALARSAGSRPASEDVLGLAAGPLGPLEVDLRGQVGGLGQDHDPIRANLQEAAEDGELLLLAAALEAQDALAEQRRSAARGAAGCPARPRCRAR